MTITPINTGAVANDGTGDKLRDGFIKVNDNFEYLDTIKLESTDIADFETTTELNARDTANRNRANHTGTQTASTISDFDTEVSNNTDVSANTSARHTHSNKALLDQIASNPVETIVAGTNVSVSRTGNSVTIDSTINGGLVGTKEVDETNIGNLKVPVYKTASGKLEYENQTGGHIIEDTGVAFTQRDTLNFTGNVVITDTGTKTEVEIGDTGVAISPSYTVTNTINDRILNGNNVSLNELTDVVGTMIGDLRVFSGLGGNAPLFIQDTEPSVTVPSLWIDTTGGNFSFNLVTP